MEAELIHLFVFWSVVVVLFVNIVSSFYRHIRMNRQIALLTEIRDLLRQDGPATTRKPEIPSRRLSPAARDNIIELGSLRK